MSLDRRATRWRSPDEPCLNCGDSTPGKYCPTCGQRKTEVLVSVRTMLADVLEDQLVLNRALPRTLGSLLFKPGALTEEYVRGRIVRYIAPFRLYLVSSVLFFVLLSFIGLSGMEMGLTGSTSPDSARVTIQAQRAALENLDTTEMPPEARAAVRQGLEQIAALDSAPAAPAPPAAPGSDSTAAPDTTSAGDVDAPLPPGVLQPWARNIDFDESADFMERALERKLLQVGHLPGRQAMQQLLRDLLEYAPHMVFLLLPVYALILKLLYIRRDRYYAEHFVFALHVHAFVFLLFTLMMLLPGAADVVLVFALLVYTWVALKRVYRQGWFRTTVKWWTLGFTYSFVLLFGLVGLAIVTLLLT